MEDEEKKEIKQKVVEYAEEHNWIAMRRISSFLKGFHSDGLFVPNATQLQGIIDEMVDEGTIVLHNTGPGTDTWRLSDATMEELTEMHQAEEEAAEEAEEAKAEAVAEIEEKEKDLEAEQQELEAQKAELTG